MNPKGCIFFICEAVSFNLERKDSIRKWLKEVVAMEEKVFGEITYVFCSDDYLHKINLEYLSHDSFTDIITFDYCDGNIINSDIFISIERVKENAVNFNASFQNELSRVIVHGILHLVGYSDKSQADKEVMRAKEDFYLSLLDN